MEGRMGAGWREGWRWDGGGTEAGRRRVGGGTEVGWRAGWRAGWGRDGGRDGGQDGGGMEVGRGASYSIPARGARRTAHVKIPYQEPVARVLP
jgi:hypothetical protein